MTLTTMVVPTSCKPTLATLLGSLDRAAREADVRLPVVLVDDRTEGVPLHTDPWRNLDTRVLAGSGHGPAHARNVGWRAAGSEWVCFLDEDVVPDTDWLPALVRDLQLAGDEVGAVQGRLRIPHSPDRGRWSAADLAVRRDVLATVGGFDERFSRPGCEDTDLLLFVAGVSGIRLGSRCSTIRHTLPEAEHPGLLDTVRMRRRHGRHWRDRAGQLAS